MPRHRLATQVAAAIRAIKAAGETVQRIDVRQDGVTIYPGKQLEGSGDRGVVLHDDAEVERAFYEGLCDAKTPKPRRKP